MNKIFLIIVCLNAYLSRAQNFPDVTTEFDNIISESRSRGQELQNKWPLDNDVFSRDINFLLTKGPIDKFLGKYYINLDSWRNLKSRIDFVKGAFKPNGQRDIKNGTLKKYNKNGGFVLYNGKKYTVEQLGNINFGIFCKAIGLPILVSTCGAGIYQLKSDECVPPSTESFRIFLSAVKRCVRNKEFNDGCLDNKGDTKMIKMGYNWF